MKKKVRPDKGLIGCAIVWTYNDVCFFLKNLSSLQTQKNQKKNETRKTMFNSEKKNQIFVPIKTNQKWELRGYWLT